MHSGEENYAADKAKFKKMKSGMGNLSDNVIKVDNRGAWVDVGGKSPGFVPADEVRKARRVAPRHPIRRCSRAGEYFASSV